MKVSGFRSYDEALQYARQLYTNAAIKRLAAKGRAVIISDSNLELLGTQYSYNDYDKFYEKHFVPLRISTVRLLTEPETIEYEKPAGSAKEEDDGLYNGGVIEDGTYIDEQTPAAGQDDNSFSIPDEQPVEKANTAVDDGNSFTIDEGTDANKKPATESGSTDNGTVVVDEEPAKTPAEDTGTGLDSFPIEDETPKEKPAPKVEKMPVEKATDQPQAQPKAQPTPQPPVKKNPDDIEFEFTDGFGSEDNNASNSKKEEKKRDSYELEDEYYDLEGF